MNYLLCIGLLAALLELPDVPGIKCTYVLNGKGLYEVEGGYLYILSGDSLIDLHDPPYFTRSATGIP